MRRVLRENALGAVMALSATAAMAWLGLVGFAWTDYELEVLPSYEALVQGHVSAFLRLAPAYGGSLIERAPFALASELWGGGSLAVFRMVAVPCLLAAAVLGLVLLGRMRAAGHSTLARAVALGVCVANPITLRGLEFGHPEDLLGGCLCVAAVLLAERERPVAAGVVLGLAIANKEWALLAAGPVLLVLVGRARWRCAASAGASATAILAPLAIASSSAFAVSARVIAAPPSPDFQPWQLWWFLGRHGLPVFGAFGVPKPGYRTAPSWSSNVSHPLIILAGVAIAVVLWLRLRGRPLPLREALLALSLVLLLRCMLDTWDTIYYTMPFLLALLAWEALGPATRPPVLSLAISAIVWVSFYWVPQHVSPDAQSLIFLAWSLPLAAWMGLHLLSSTRSALAGGSARGGDRLRSHQETTVSSLERLVRTS